MTRDELAAHKATSYGRDDRSDDGFDDMEINERRKWATLSGWGQDGWDIGEWPYVVISHRTKDDKYQLLQVCEGDHEVYTFDTEADRDAATDYLFIWYALGKDYSGWDAEGLTHDEREALDAGTLAVPDKYRGPFSWARCNAPAT
jgi:hypothetical protein